MVEVRLTLDVYANDGLLHGRICRADQGEPVAFSGVLDLVAAIERLDPESGDPLSDSDLNQEAAR